MILRFLPDLYRYHIRCDVACVPVSRPDANGYCSLGISNYAWRTIFENARTVIFEINEHYPTLLGVDGSNRVHLSEADYIVEGEHEPLPLRTYKDSTPIDIEIAKHVVKEIPDGATLSLGVGGVPFTVAKMLAESDLKDLGCHTGTISDAFLALHKAGKLTNARKEIDTGRSTFNLAMGSQELYNWLESEPDLFRPSDVDYVHALERMGQISNFIGIMGGVQLDLMGQENAESVGKRQLSSIGGQLDFLGGRLPLQGRQVLHFPELCPQGQRGQPQVQHCALYPRRQHGVRTPHPHSVCCHGVRHRQPRRPCPQGAGKGYDRNCPSFLPGGTGALCSRDV